MSTRRLSGEVTSLRRQVALEARRKPWVKAAHQNQHEVLQKVRSSLITDISKALESAFGSGATCRRTSPPVSPQVRK